MKILTSESFDSRSNAIKRVIKLKMVQRNLSRQNRHTWNLNERSLRRCVERTVLLKFLKNLATVLKIIMLACQNNYVGRSDIMSNAAKNFEILATSLNLYNHFDDPNKIIFRSVSSEISRHFNKIVLLCGNHPGNFGEPLWKRCVRTFSPNFFFE